MLLGSQHYTLVILVFIQFFIKTLIQQRLDDVEVWFQ